MARVDVDGAATAREPSPRVIRVLVLDNDRMMRELMAFALRSKGLEAITAGSLEEAELVLGQSDGLLLDFHLGGGHSGAQVARRWSAERRLPPFWLVTGVPEEPEVLALGELEEMRGVVGKPFSLLELAEGVRSTLRILAPSAGGEAPGSRDGDWGYAPEPPQPEPGDPDLPETQDPEDLRSDDLH